MYDGGQGLTINCSWWELRAAAGLTAIGSGRILAGRPIEMLIRCGPNMTIDVW